MTWLHRSAQQILFQQRRITLPALGQALGHRTLRFSEVNEEFPVNGRRVDCLCVMEDGHELAAEIRVTHEVDASKLDDLRSANPDRDVVEIDLRPFRSVAPDWVELTKAVCDSPQNIRWLYAAETSQESNEADRAPAQRRDGSLPSRLRRTATFDFLRMAERLLGQAPVAPRPPSRYSRRQR